MILDLQSHDSLTWSVVVSCDGSRFRFSVLLLLSFTSKAAKFFDAIVFFGQNELGNSEPYTCARRLGGHFECLGFRVGFRVGYKAHGVE